MKKIILGISLMVMASGASAACSLKTIQGNYAAAGPMDTFGLVNDNVHDTPMFLIGRMIFDGRGGILLRNIKIGTAGVVIPGNGGGSYSLRPNCTGSATVNLNLTGAGTTRVKLDMIVSGSATNPHIDMMYSDIQVGGESGLISLTKIRL